jgi:hypothetical protein
MKVNRGMSRDAIKAAANVRQAVPDFDDDGNLLAVRRETDEEFNTRLKREEASRRKRSGVEEGSLLDIGGDIASEIVDPAAWVAAPAKAASTMGRLLKLAAFGSAYEGTAGTLDQLAASGEIEDGEEIAKRAIAGGVALPVLDSAVRMGGAVLRKVMGKDYNPAKVGEKHLKEANDLIDEMNGRMTWIANRRPDLTLPQAKELAMKDMGIRTEWLEDAQAVTGKGQEFIVDPTTKGFKTLALLDRNKTLRELAKRDRELELGLPKPKAGLTDVVNVWSSAVKDINERLFFRARHMEHGINARTVEGSEMLKPWGDKFRKLNKEDKTALKMALANNDDAGARQIMRSQEGMEQDFDRLRVLLSRYAKEMQETGHDVDLIEDYFPRLVKDLDGLEKSKPVSVRRKEAKRERAKLVYSRTPTEASKVLDNEMRGAAAAARPISTERLGSLEERAIRHVTEDNEGFYADPVAAFEHYVHEAASNIEKRKFLGKHATTKPVGVDEQGNAVATQMDWEESIGKIIREEAAQGNMSVRDRDRLRHLLNARFVTGDKTANHQLNRIKNAFYVSTIGQVDSALTQLGDIGSSAYVNGVGNTIKSLVSPKQASMVDAGVNQVAQEMAHTEGFAKVLDKTLRASGFKKIDALGKNTLINSFLNKTQKQLRTRVGEGEFRTKYGKAFSSIEEVDKLVDDVAKGNLTPDVKFVLFNELANVQPISLSEYPVTYLRQPNGRVLYALHSFMLKQMDLLRNTAIKNMREGKVAKGAADLARYGAIMTVANASVGELKEYLTGKDLPVEERLGDSLMKNFGMSEYGLSQAFDEGKWGEVLSITLPGANILESIYNGEAEKNIPLFGRLIHNWLGGGLEQWQERRNRKEMEEFSVPTEELE